MALMSMTGYGVASGDSGYAVEIKSTNHKFLEIRTHLPSDLLTLEPRVAEFFRRRVKRGSLDVFITRSGQSASLRKPRLNLELAQRYVEIAAQVSEKTGATGDLPVAALLAMKDVVDFEITAEELDTVFNALVPSMGRAIEVFELMRAREGASIAEVLQRYLDRIAMNLAQVEADSPKALATQREKLRARLQQIKAEVQPDEYRLEQELLYFAEKSDISEEVERLRSHIGQFSPLFACKETCGKKMDFIIQEMNREANTIASKTQSTAVSHLVIEIKTDLDRMREQVQNVE